MNNANSKVEIPDLPISAYDDPQTPVLSQPERWKTLAVEHTVFSVWKSIAQEFEQLQKSVNTWALTNFKEKAGGINPLLGMVEETGELAHCVLKKVQGIRGTPEEHDANAVDAIGDIVVYLLNHLHFAGVRVEDSVLAGLGNYVSFRLTSSSVLIDDVERGHLVLSLSNRVASLAAAHRHKKEQSQHADGVFIILELLARSYGFTLIEILRKTWTIVQKRNWVADPAAGGNHTHEAPVPA